MEVDCDVAKKPTLKPNISPMRTVINYNEIDSLIAPVGRLHANGQKKIIFERKKKPKNEENRKTLVDENGEVSEKHAKSERRRLQNFSEKKKK